MAAAGTNHRWTSNLHSNSARLRIHATDGNVHYLLPVPMCLHTPVRCIQDPTRSVLAASTKNSGITTARGMVGRGA